MKIEAELGIIHPLRNASKEDVGCSDLVYYCLVYMEAYATERYERGRGSQTR